MKQESVDISVACRLSNDELRAREATLLAQFKSALVATEELADGYAFRVPGDEKLMRIVLQLIVAERACCPFLTFELAAHPNMGPIDLRVSGPAGTTGFLEALLLKDQATSPGQLPSPEI
jgi:hypothetical protein